MILVDSSVWIDYLKDKQTVQTEVLHQALGRVEVMVGDLMLVEILQGIGSDAEFERVRVMLKAFRVIDIGGEEIAIVAARNFRSLRSLGVTVRKTIDLLIATRCIESGYRLLHNDRDFDAFALHLGLMVVE